MKDVTTPAGALLLLAAQIAVIDTGSTNLPGLHITLETTGHSAMVEHRNGAKRRVTLSKEICERLRRDLTAAGPLSALPARHCMKSASFGSSLFIEADGVRSPDLSCPQQDPRLQALKKDADEILSAAKKY